MYMNIKLISNNFTNNEAVNGGALYFSNKNNVNKIDSYYYYKIENLIKDNIIEENTADNFGGGIYSEYNQFKNSKVENNIIINNKAGILGGGLFSLKPVNETLFDLTNCKIKNNTVNSLTDEYSSNPYLLSLKTKINKNENEITTGDYFPLIFNVKDNFGNIVYDVTKFYSSMTLKILLNEISEDGIIDYSDNSNYYIEGNIGLFINGKFDLSNFQIYANPGHYMLKILIENYNNELIYDFNDIKINVKECGEYQIKMYNSNGILYCQNPICSPNCPVNTSAICIPAHKEFTNNINENKCICLDGWQGLYCNEKIFINYE